jgi:leucyl/phenylalanyl-tRNA--protein transferase
MRACGTDRSLTNRSWINEGIVDAYVALHQLGFAHSVEAWLGDKLVGGLYGVHIGGAFFGESMFSRPDLGGTNASKVCLVHLVKHLRERGFTLLDTQFSTPHLAQFGCVEVDAEHYLAMLNKAVRTFASWTD